MCIRNEKMTKENLLIKFLNSSVEELLLEYDSFDKKDLVSIRKDFIIKSELHKAEKLAKDLKCDIRNFTELLNWEGKLDNDLKDLKEHTSMLWVTQLILNNIYTKLSMLKRSNVYSNHNFTKTHSEFSYIKLKRNLC